MKKLSIVADENIPGLNALLSEFADIRYLPGRSISHHDVKDADVLLVRSVTRVNAALLQDSAIRFVGTCTIGVDHIDTEYLQQHNIAFASAPGCNAAAVVDYVLAAMLAVYNDISVLQNKVVGIVGCGEVGSRLLARLQQLDIKTRVYDPYKPQNNATIDDILQCDIISLHVPLVKAGEYPTWHLLAEKELNAIKSKALLINTSRGEVIDNQYLYELLVKKRFYCVLDVYEEEPSPSIELLETLDIATAHIAGYSAHGKLRGTLQVVDALFKCFSINTIMPDLLLPLTQELSIDSQDVATVIKSVYDIQADSAAFITAIKAVNEAERGKAFDAYRKNYPVRYEWSYQTLTVNTTQRDIIKKLGFKVF